MYKTSNYDVRDSHHVIMYFVYLQRACRTVMSAPPQGVQEWAMPKANTPPTEGKVQPQSIPYYISLHVYIYALDYIPSSSKFIIYSSIM